MVHSFIPPCMGASSTAWLSSAPNRPACTIKVWCAYMRTHVHMSSYQSIARRIHTYVKGDWI